MLSFYLHSCKMLLIL